MNKLAELRRKRGLTQVQLAARSGVHVKAIARMETGGTDLQNMRLFTAARLAKALKVHAEDLMSNDI